MVEYNRSRREFIADSTRIVLAAAVTFAGIHSCKSGKEADGTTGATDDTVALDVSLPEYSVLANVGGTKKINVEGEDKPVIVYRIDQTGVVALSSECPYDQCEVGDLTGTKFVCPCCGAEYDEWGTMTKSPQGEPGFKHDLASFWAGIEGNIITITWGN
ncbi:MAG: Rieske 2Fe-2S domain-containing protein [Chitinivibrionales bacterium]|nr:Rieske 2Fe-2S domain-containing protein [Chitinivibrionales bacterium]MBD3396469.1 Rieske 2Fe-2S domain-containing protein [Chitinivibrionales bacterium]